MRLILRSLAKCETNETSNKRYLVAFTITGCYSQSKTKDDRIGLEKIEELFNNMKSNGVTTDKKMLYGYFFTNHTRAPLESVANN